MVQSFWYSSNVLLLLLGGRSWDGPCVHKRGSTLHQRRPDWQHDTAAWHSMTHTINQHNHFHGVKASPSASPSPTPLPFSIDRTTVSPFSLLPPPYVVFPHPDPLLLPLTFFCPFHFYAPSPFFTKPLYFFFLFFIFSLFPCSPEPNLG